MRAFNFQRYTVESWRFFFLFFFANDALIYLFLAIFDIETHGVYSFWGLINEISILDWTSCSFREIKMRFSSYLVFRITYNRASESRRALVTIVISNQVHKGHPSTRSIPRETRRTYPELIEGMCAITVCKLGWWYLCYFCVLEVLRCFHGSTILYNIKLADD